MEGEDNGQATESEQTVHGELGLQYGALLDDSSAIAVQVKIPLTIVYTTLDVFWQLPSEDDKTYIGVGGELSITPAIYLAVTRFLNDITYVSFTPRVLSQFDNLSINQQVSFGMDTGAIDISAFVGYQHIFGEGIDIDIDVGFEDDASDEDRRNDFAIFGIAARF